jgi:transposase InsO family protein
MAQKVIAMEVKLLAVLSSGLPLPVARVCRELGISRQTFYKYRRRWLADGPAGLVERSRRPHRSPGQMSAELEDEIVRLRKGLPLDNGAQTIAYHLERSGRSVPSIATIHRVLVRRGQVIAQPQKRPRSSWRRFEWPAPNACWQIDATMWVLADGREVWIMDVLDDHSRVLIAARVWPQATGDAAWDAFAHGVSDWGLPAHVLSDNGTCFTGRFFSGGEADFERTLRKLGVRQILSSPAHPQTCGKLERSHLTTKTWLSRHDRATNEDELQTQLDEWRHFYNHDRPHTSLAGATPFERWSASPPVRPGEPIHETPDAQLRRVGPTGVATWKHYKLAIGTDWAGHNVLVIAHDREHLTIHGPNGLQRNITIDPTRRYQPNGLPAGRRPKRNRQQ